MSIIKITNMAWKKLFDIGRQANKKRFLFSASSGGCNGFNFDLNIMKDTDYSQIKKKNPNFLSKNDIDVYIDPMSEFYLIGTTIDFINEDYNKNIFESKFIFDIDKKLASTCGCGVSFTPKNYVDE